MNRRLYWWQVLSFLVHCHRCGFDYVGALAKKPPQRFSLPGRAGFPYILLGKR
ncbi:MAG: hypothetical protein ABSC01_01655 [Verrucomicrobiota bacterium]|jgi:hypothetical protein